MSGMTITSKQTALAAVLPNGTAAYIGLFTELPTDDVPTGGVEATGSGYARKSHSAWINITSGDNVYRVNNGVVTFNALTANLTGINGWGVWDAASGGNLLAYGHLINWPFVSDYIEDKTFTSGNNPGIADQGLQIGLD